MTENKIYFQETKPFNFKIVYSEATKSSRSNTNHSHIHDECEVYINLTGDVSFIVENHIYPIKPGDIIITRPFEYHHCVYHSDKLHKHFCIWFQSSGNEGLLDLFFKRAAGENNHLTLSADDSKSLIDLSTEMAKENFTDVKNYLNFFKLLSLLQKANIADKDESDYPEDVICAISYMNENFSGISTVEEIAEHSHVSINTLERHFSATIGTTPSDYLRKKRLANAAKLLSEGLSVTEASDKSGFPDYSWFIALFKKHYGITPHKYKNSLK